MSNGLFHRNRMAALIASAAIAGTAQAQESASRYQLMEEVVVTAQKREENFMSVPVTVNAFTAQDMINTGAATIQDIDAFMPGVEIGDTEGGTTQVGITVRGVSSPNISSGQDPSVATFYDDAYMPRAVTSIPFTDIARTEVLKGPQGTLFGRNATAGVINIVPNKPGEEFEGFTKARLGSENLVRVEGMGNAPDTEIQRAADYEDRDEMPRAAIGVSKYAYQGSDDPFRGKDQHDVVGAGGEYNSERNNEEETREMYGVSLKLNHNLDDQWSVFGIASYREWDTTNLQEEDGTAQPRRYLDTNNIEESDIFYTELRFNFVDDRWNVIFGGNYSQEDVFQRTDIGLLADSYMQFLSGQLLPAFGFPSDPDLHAWDLFADQGDDFWLLVSNLAGGMSALPPSFAGSYFTETMDNTGDFVNWGVFGDASYQLTDTVRVSAGLRYSYDEKEYSWQTFDQDLDWPFAPARVAYDPSQTGAPEDEWFDKFTRKDDWSKTTGRLVADWQFTDYAMLYGSVATGYKSGGFDGQSFQSFAAGSFDPEEMTSYEIGVKGDFFEDVLRIEAAVFHHELDGRQRSVSKKDGPDDPTASPGVINSDEETDGIELIVTWSITDTLRVAGLTTYRETESISDQYFNAAGDLVGGERDDSDTNTAYTLKFDWTPSVPVGYLLVHMNYEFVEDPGPDANTAIFATGPWYFQDKKRLNARVAWSNENDTIEVALWGDNLLDEEYASNPGGFAADDLAVFHTNIENTLTWGVDLRYSF